MKIYFLRHGQTDWNAQRRIQGHTNIPLNKTGIEQAKKAKEELDKIEFDICFTSPLDRARQTAEIVLEGRNIPIELAPEIMERNFGEFEGTSYDVADKLALRAWLTTKLSKGETTAILFKRISDFLDDLKLNYVDKKSILLVSHGGVARCVKWYFEGKPEEDGQLIKHPNCAIVCYEA